MAHHMEFRTKDPLFGKVNLTIDAKAAACKLEHLLPRFDRLGDYVLELKR